MALYCWKIKSHSSQPCLHIRISWGGLWKMSLPRSQWLFPRDDALSGPGYHRHFFNLQCTQRVKYHSFRRMGFRCDLNRISILFLSDSLNPFTLPCVNSFCRQAFIIDDDCSLISIRYIIQKRKFLFSSTIEHNLRLFSGPA